VGERSPDDKRSDVVNRPGEENWAQCGRHAFPAAAYDGRIEQNSAHEAQSDSRCGHKAHRSSGQERLSSCGMLLAERWPQLQAAHGSLMRAKPGRDLQHARAVSAWV
jgi:hypothetical protein